MSNLWNVHSLKPRHERQQRLKNINYMPLEKALFTSKTSTIIL